MKSKKILIVIVALVELITLKPWIGCKDFASSFHFSAFDTKLRVDAEIANDKGYSIHIVRLFHNKLFATINDVSNEYISFWNIHFFAMFFSLIGLFGISIRVILLY